MMGNASEDLRPGLGDDVVKRRNGVAAAVEQVLGVEV